MNPRGFAVYFLATPAFWLVEPLVGFDVRVAGLEAGTARGVYYAALVVVGFVCWRRPSWAPAIAVVEGSANLLLLILSVLGPLWDAGAGLAPPEAAGRIGPLLNFVIVAPVTVLAIKRAEWALARRARR